MQVICEKSFDTRGPEGRFSMKKGKSGELPDAVAQRLIRTKHVRAKGSRSGDADDSGGKDADGTAT